MGGLLLRVAGVVAALAAPLSTAAAQAERAAELDSRRRVGAAHYENDDFSLAAAEFRRCTELAPDAAADFFNLGLVEMRAENYADALAALAAAEARAPGLLAIHYVRGIIYKRQGEFEAALGELGLVVERDPLCRGAHYNLGVCYKALRRFPEAIECFKRKVALSPDDPSTHYQLISLYRRVGDVDNAERHKEIFARVKDTVAESEKTPEALERSVYSVIMGTTPVTGDLTADPPAHWDFVLATAEAGLTAAGISAAQPPASFRDRYLAATGGTLALGDYDADGDLDLFVASGVPGKENGGRLWRTQGDGTFTDQTAAAGLDGVDRVTDAIFGDYDNDGWVDLYVVRDGPNRLFHNQGDRTFADVSAASGADEPDFGRRALFVDYDHDNDLDILVANEVDYSAGPETGSWPADFPGQVNALLRNNGDGSFADYSDQAGILIASSQTRDALYGDFDADHDTDLLLINADDEVRLFVNARMGAYSISRAFDPPLPSARAATAADLDHDGDTDLVVSTGTGLQLYLNDGAGRFAGQPIPAAGTPVDRMVVCDFNNDGWSDLLAVSWSAEGLSLLAGSGAGAFAPVALEAGLRAELGRVTDVAAADLDGDLVEEILLLAPDRGPILLRSAAQVTGRGLRIRLTGKRVNRSGYGATVEIAAGGHYQRRVYDQGWLHFGVGRLETIDVVRVVWPNGVAQNVISVSAGKDLGIEELIKVSASCAFLYAYDGRGFGLINEILGIGPLGVPMAPDLYHQPDCTELTLIPGAALRSRDGYYELRLTEELRETAYVDQIHLRVVDHPPELTVFPNEMFTAPPFPQDKLFAVPERRPPIAAYDDRGNDVLELVRERDGRYPTFPLTPYDGLAEPHSLILDLGDLSHAEQILLCLDSWIYWSESSIVMAVSQDPRYAFAPLSLEVHDAEGQWQTAIPSVGLPTSKGAIVPVDLTGCFPGEDYLVRLSSTFCLYVDQVFVATRDEAHRCRVTMLPVATADLHYRGFSRRERDADGYERFDYQTVSPTGSWSPPAGNLTRYGDVRPLLRQIDNRLVIFGPGDELSLRFRTGALPELPAGWARDFVFYANGWVKDGDLNTKFSETVAPLPFHGMSGYPYPESESYPQTVELSEYLRTFNTRPSRSTVGQLPRGR